MHFSTGDVIVDVALVDVTYLCNLLLYFKMSYMTCVNLCSVACRQIAGFLFFLRLVIAIIMINQMFDNFV